MIEKMMSLFKHHLKAIHNLEFYDYQLEIVRRIFSALIQNLRLTKGATEEDIKRLKLEELAVEISRQAGKTTAIVHAIEFVLIYFTQEFGKAVQIGIFAPQKEQAKTDFDRLKNALRKSTELTVMSAPADEIDKAREESNARTLVLPNGSSCYIFPVTITSKPESKTLDLIIFEESQDLKDSIVKESIWPMGATTNAPRLYIGTAGTQICYFYRLGQAGQAIKMYFDKIATERRKLFESSGNAMHLLYERTISEEIEKHGIESDEIARPYFGKWLLGTGQFTTAEDLDQLYTERSKTYLEKSSECFAGIDTAKHPDSTIVTVLRYNRTLGKKEILNWLELRGDNYKDQFDIIVDFLGNYNIIGLAIDSTAQGDFMPDMFEKETQWQSEMSGLYRVKFSATSKDVIYKNLKVTIKELLTTLPKLDKKEGERFRQQLLDLQQEYKGQLLSVHHPDDPNAHDDYPDSWALAEYAYARHNESRPDLQVATVAMGKEKKAEKDAEGKILNYWPNDHED